MRFSLFLVITSILILGNISECFGGNPKQILVLHSYNSGLSWTDAINRGIFESFKNENYRTVDIRCEFMDTKHFEDSAYFIKYKNYLDQKYKHTPIDYIICSDNAAFNFLAKYHNELFKDVPVFFCGLNYCDSIPENFTGIMEDIDLQSNIELILKNHPEYNKIYIVNDRSITARSISTVLNKLITNKFPELKYEYVTDYTFEELKQKLASLKEDDIVLMLLFNFDKKGTNYSYDVILDDLMPHCKVPMYGTWDFYLGNGIVGGKIANGYDHGIMVSNMVKLAINGKPIKNIPVVIGPTAYQFDYKMLKHHNISRVILPKNSKFINLPFDFIFRNKQFFIFLAITILLLLALIVVLFRAMKKAQYSLKVEHKLLTTIEEKSTQLSAALEKAEQSNKLKAAFLSNISHEIRTPMNGILGFAELLKFNNPDEEQIKFLDTINKCSQQLLNIINDLVDISKIGSNQVTLYNEIIPINQVISDLVFTFSKASKTGNKFICGTRQLPNEQQLIQTDSIKLTQVLTNLLSNANKFTENGTIETGYTVCENKLVFYVRDSGIGIAKEDQEIIFERFRQADKGKDRMYGGTGLGLSISKAFIELMGGNIWLESTPDVGSTFFFTIPYVKSNNHTSVHIIPEFKPLNICNLKILIVEDDPINFQLLETLLQRNTSQIFHATSGEQAIEILKKIDNLDLVLMDLKLPLMDGFEATRLIKSLKPSLPIIAQTAFVNETDRENAFNAGCNDFLTKPINSDLLFDALAANLIRY